MGSLALCVRAPVIEELAGRFEANQRACVITLTDTPNRQLRAVCDSLTLLPDDNNLVNSMKVI